MNSVHRVEAADLTDNLFHIAPIAFVCQRHQRIIIPLFIMISSAFRMEPDIIFVSADRKPCVYPDIFPVCRIQKFSQQITFFVKRSILSGIYGRSQKSLNQIKNIGYTGTCAL